jgi:two-component system LytT family response regulator
MVPEKEVALMDKVTILVVDDEPIARRGLAAYVKNDPRLELVGECANGYEALKALAQFRPQVILLDIEMPEMNGLQILEEIAPAERPFVVFVTAHNQYALDAFRVHAVDYVLKPVTADGIRAAFDIVVERVRTNSLDQFRSRLEEVLQQFEQRSRETQQEEKSIQRIVVKENGRIFFLDVSEIDWIEASGNYVNVHAKHSKYLLEDSMNNLEDKLDSRTFLRIHRSTIVNIRSVKEFRRYLRGSFVILLKDNTKLFSSRRFFPRIESFLKEIH